MGGTSTIPRPRLSLANGRHCNTQHTILFQGDDWVVRNRGEILLAGHHESYWGSSESVRLAAREVSFGRYGTTSN